jgi:hypothetical protein
MRHSQVDKRARRTAPVQCVADYGHDVHKDAPIQLADLTFPISLEPLSAWIKRNMPKSAVAFNRE